MKLRYKILILNITVTLLYYIGFIVLLPIKTEGLSVLSAFSSAIYYSFLFVVNYNWIHLIWLGFIVTGIIKKKREFIYGGLFSIILSALILFIFIMSIQY
jgi:hypothetical protein